MNVLEIWSALYKGYELRNVEAWKHTQAAINILTPILLTLFHTANIDVDKSLVELVAGGIVGVVNLYFVFATSKRVGL